MGCRTPTPELDAMTPVIMGKKDPPICAKTKTKASAVERELGSNSLDATDMPWSLSVTAMWARKESVELTVAKKGPEKKPRRLTATEAAMIFGTLLATGG